MLRCRDIGHTWEERFDWNGKRAPWGSRRVLHCGTCSTERIEVVSSDGSVMSRHYDYDPTYKSVSGLSKNDARRERVTQLHKRRRQAGLRRS